LFFFTIFSISFIRKAILDFFDEETEKLIFKKYFKGTEVDEQSLDNLAIKISALQLFGDR